MAVHDELDIDYGVLRLKLGGGDNGHNGLKSMTKAMGTDYHRVRFGIGRPPGRMQVADFVLKDFSSAERGAGLLRGPGGRRGGGAGLGGPGAGAEHVQLVRLACAG
ncbi:Peptidyl-tRNA hydrolase [Streptomyces alboniger]